MKSNATIAIPLSTSLWLIVLGAFTLCGCSSGNDGRTSSLAGRVTLDSQPLEMGSLLLLAESGDGVGAALSDDGTFSVDCKPGTYQVAVIPPEPITGPDGVPVATSTDQTEIPRKYTDVATSLLTVDVGEGDNSADFALVSK